MIPLKITGGARIGQRNVTIPFATLIVNSEKLELKASIIGYLVFQPDDVISIIPYSGLFSQGIKIIHRVQKYDSEVIFWVTEKPNSIIDRIAETGFILNKITPPSIAIRKIQDSGSFPFKQPVVIIYAAIFNFLLLSDFFRFASKGGGIIMGFGSIAASLSVGVISALLLASRKFSLLVLKEGRTLNDIKRFLYLTFIISILVTAILSFVKSLE